MLTIAAAELKVGDSFKLNSRQRKANTISQIIDLEVAGERYKKSDPAHFATIWQNRLLFMTGCGQTSLLKTDNVLLIN